MEIKYVNMRDVYAEVNAAEVSLEVDGTDLIIRIQYLEGNAADIKCIVEKGIE